MYRNLLIRICLLLIAACLTIICPIYAKADSSCPNILVIVTDDQGYGDLSAFAHHASDIHTPNMDRLATEGILCSQAYVSAPVCSPSRAGWITGRYQQRWDPKASWGPGVPDAYKTLPEYLKRVGYVTGKIGKSDFGEGYYQVGSRSFPTNHGYDDFLGFTGHGHDYFLLNEAVEKNTPDPHGNSAQVGPLFENKNKKSYEDGYTTDIFTDRAIGFMKQHKDNPFFLTLSYNSVHHLVHQVPKKYLDKYGVKEIPAYDPETMGKYKQYYGKYSKLSPISDKDMRGYFLANLNCLDDNIGRLLDAMDQMGLADDTLVIFFSDNGGSPLTGGNNRPLRGSKYIMYEGGLRVPFMVRWPGKLPAGKQYDHRISTLDILPSCLQAAGIAMKGKQDLDGTSFLDALKNNTPSPSSQKPIFWKFDGQYAVREGDWKLCKTWDYTKRKPTSQILQGPKSKSDVQLFNIKEDLAEQKDVSKQHPEIVEKLKSLYTQWETQCRQSTK